MREKATFDVLSEPWIPVAEEDGATRELGLLETLERAHQLRAVQAPSPLVEHSVYRFLIIFLMNMLRPEDTEALGELLEEGRFDPDRIRDYVAMCQDEGVTFDLFDEERPFLQTAYRGEWDQKPKPVIILDYTASNGNNHIHFDHRREQMVYTPGKALRMMLAAQIFCTAGIQGYPSNVNGAPPWFALIRGGSRCSRPLCLGCWRWIRSGYPLTGRLFCGGTQKKWRTRSRWRRHPGCLGCSSRSGGST